MIGLNPVSRSGVSLDCCTRGVVKPIRLRKFIFKLP